MSRAARAAALALGVATTLSLAGAALPGAGAPGRAALAPGSAAAADCSWQRYSKQVVKHVKRHGQRRRVVRTRRWWTCEPLGSPAPTLGPPPVATPAPDPAPSTPPVEPEPDPGITRLGVKAVEYSYTLSRPSVVPGELIVELNNQGEDAHNLNLQREGSGEAPLEVPETGSVQHRSARFTLQPGTYKLWCSLPTHEEEGMVATLQVKEN